MIHPWYKEAIFYHIYPLGFCGAPERNDYHSPPVERLYKVCKWIPHIKELGVNALYVGPLFESKSHGYDTVNYFELDRRLGTNDTLKQVIRQLHKHGIRVVLDGVFHHVSRDFFAFQDLRQHQQHSMFKEWFHGVNFQQRSSYHDPFSYEGWNGHLNLVKLNVTNSFVVEHLFEADALEFRFMKRLSAFTRELKTDFWLMGEVVHGDYTRWANPEMLHATTNYECYKGLYSSHNDKNYFEIAYSLNRLFDEEYGLYKDLYLYNFVDNHDVNRVASTLHNQVHLYPLYLLLFTMPGIPSIYYGSEWGLKGVKQPNSDQPLRPELHLEHMLTQSHADLKLAIARMSQIHHQLSALKHGTYKQLFVASEQFAFLRQHGQKNIIVAVNASQQPVTVHIPIHIQRGTTIDRLNHGHTFQLQQGQLSIEIPACWGRVLEIRQ
jgi:cyclomaltodextrinase